MKTDVGTVGALLRTITIAAMVAFNSACTEPAPREQVPRAAIDTDWPTIPVDAKFGQVSAVDVDSHGHIFVFHRAGRIWEEPFPSEPIADPTVFMFASNGTLLAKWGAGEFIMPHGLSVDADDNIWLTDVAREQVFRFSHDGEQQIVLGERGVTAQDAGHFGRPADIAFVNGKVLVADGYVNTRVAEFDSEGQFLDQFGDFQVAHAIAVDDERIYVADRENARIQLFSQDGKLLETRKSPTGSHTYSLKPLGGGWLVAVEGRDGADRTGAIIRVYRPDGTIDRSLDIGLEGENASLGHDLAIGPDGMAYLTDVYGDRVVRFELAAKGEAE